MLKIDKRTHIAVWTLNDDWSNNVLYDACVCLLGWLSRRKLPVTQCLLLRRLIKRIYCVFVVMSQEKGSHLIGRPQLEEKHHVSPRPRFPGPVYLPLKNNWEGHSSASLWTGSLEWRLGNNPAAHCMSHCVCLPWLHRCPEAWDLTMTPLLTWIVCLHKCVHLCVYIQ